VGKRERYLAPALRVRGRADLRSFSATFGKDGQITDLSFATDALSTPTPGSGFGSEGFIVTSLAAGGAHSANKGRTILTTGTLTIPGAVVPPVSLPAPTATPEPASLATWGHRGPRGARLRPAVPQARDRLNPTTRPRRIAARRVRLSADRRGLLVRPAGWRHSGSGGSGSTGSQGWRDARRYFSHIAR
jgi:hypothetical protein